MKQFKFLLVIFCLGAVVLTSPSHAAELTCTSGDVTGLGSGDYCYTEPTYYGITVYEMGVCTAAPTAPTTTAVVDAPNCHTVFTSSAGSLVEVQNGGTSTPSGTFTRPPNGTYTHGYMRMNNTFLIKGSLDFGASHTDITDQYCVTKTATTDNEGSNSANTYTCSASPGTPGTVTTELTDFSGGDHSNTTSATVGQLTVYLLDSNQHLATAAECTQAGADGILGVQAFTSAITMTDQSTVMDATITVSQGMTVSVTGTNAAEFDSGPFQLVLSVQ